MEPIRHLLPRSAPWTLHGSHSLVYEILADPNRWIKGSLFDFDESNRYRMHTRETATRCCLMGALEFVPKNHRETLVFHVKKLLYDIGQSSIVSDFNDDDATTHATLLFLWRYIEPGWRPWNVFGYLHDWFVARWGRRG